MSVTISHSTPSYEEILALRERYQLLEDWRRFNEKMAREIHDRTIFYAIMRGEELLGWLWFEGYVANAPQLGCIMGACVEREYWGKWSAEALPQLLDIVGMTFEDSDVPRIQVEFDRRRSYVEKFFKKLGFEFEGKRPNGLVQNGRRRDMTILGLTEESFKEFRNDSVPPSSD